MNNNIKHNVKRVCSQQYIGTKIKDETNMNPVEYYVYRLTVLFDDNTPGIVYKIVDQIGEYKDFGAKQTPFFEQCPQITIDPFGNNPPKLLDIMMTVYEFKHLFKDMVDECEPMIQEQKINTLKNIVKELGLDTFLDT